MNAKPNELEGLEINYKRAFVHEINGVSVQLEITNNTGKNIKIYEGDLISGPVDGFKLSHQNSYSLNGETLKKGKKKTNELLLYFDDRAKATQLEWVQPTFKVIIDGETHEIKGEKMYVE